MKTVGEKIKAIKDILAQAFTVTADPAPVPDPVQDPAPAAEPQPEQFADPVPAPGEPAPAPAPQPTMEQVLAAVNELSQRVQALEAAAAPAPGTTGEDMQRKFEAQEDQLARMKEAFKLQHQALEDVLTVIGEFAEAPAADPETKPTGGFKSRDGMTRAQKVERLLTKMGVHKPEPAPADQN